MITHIEPQPKRTAQQLHASGILKITQPHWHPSSHLRLNSRRWYLYTIYAQGSQIHKASLMQHYDDALLRPCWIPYKEVNLTMDISLAFISNSINDNTEEDHPNYGWLTVRESHPNFNEPQMVTVFYPVQQGRRSEFKELIALSQETGRLQEDSTFAGRYHLHGDYGSTIITLANGGDTTPIKTEITELPPPTRRVETRWVHGRWEKLLKNKGWVKA